VIKDGQSVRKISNPEHHLNTRSSIIGLHGMFLSHKHMALAFCVCIKKHNANSNRASESFGHLNVVLLAPCAGVLLAVLPVENGPPVFIHLDGGDDDFAGVNTNGDASTVRFVAVHTVDVDDPFLAVDLCHFALATHVFPAGDSDFVILANR